jgi:hypothetical protein
MKKTASILAAILVVSLFVSSCKTHGGCAAYSKANTPVAPAKSI